MHVLVADDERDLVWALRHCLCDEGYRVSCAHDGVEALALIRQLQPDLVILDVVMPGMNGFDVCHRVRQDTSVAHIPIMFLTVRDAIADRVYGLDSGSDDYMTKPFDLREIKARVRALYRRKQATCSQEQEDTEQDTVLSLPPLSLNLRTHRLQIDERVVQLTETEFNLLHHLMGHPDELFTSEQLLKQVWDYPWGTGDPSLVRWHIRNLRAKIEPDPAQPVFLRTIPRQGYFLAVQTMS